MRLRNRIAACGLLLAMAALCASYTIADLRGPQSPEAAQETAAPMTETEHFTLCARNGCVAVLDPALGETAVVTDIELATLREADRKLIEAGLPVESREQLLVLLEDLGS